MNEDKKLVVKANGLIRAGYRLSLMEQRLVLAAIIQIDRTVVIGHLRMYRVTVDEMAELLGLPYKSLHKDLEEAANRLFDREFTIMLANGKPARTRWVETIQYLHGEGAVLLVFSTSVMPYLTELKEQFTSYRYRDIAGLTSVYAVRLFELMMQWKSVGRFPLPVDELRFMWELQNKYRKVAELRRNVLDVAVEQITEHTPYKLSYQANKTGRSITSFSFTFSLKKSAAKPKSKIASTEPSTRAEQMAAEAREFAEAIEKGA
jgi:plasmid replication initiation protein